MKNSKTNLDFLRKKVHAEIFAKNYKKVEEFGFTKEDANIYIETECKAFEGLMSDYALNLITVQDVIRFLTQMKLNQLTIFEVIEEANKTKDDLNA